MNQLSDAQLDELFRKEGVDPDAIPHTDKCVKCREHKKELDRLCDIEDKTDLLKRQLEAAKRSEDFHRNACDGLRKTIDELKKTKASSPTIKLYECPHCREFVNMSCDRVLKHNAYWHEACWLKSKRNGKVSHFRRRARRWRNFKLFLSRAFWSFW